MNAETGFQTPALQRSLADVVAEYEEKRAAIPKVVEGFKRAVRDAEMAGSVGGTFGESVWGRGSPYIAERNLESALLRSAWLHVYEGLQIERIAPAADRRRFETALHTPPEFTIDNLRATFGNYVLDPRHHILRGLAECFTSLDPWFRSHTKVKVGKAGLPKRIIIRNVSSYGDGWGNDRLRDTINALRVYRGEPHIGFPEFRRIVESAARDAVEFDGMKLVRYQNGNAHLHFGKEMLDEVNRALAEFYGDVLPDTELDDEERDLFRHQSTAVAKDLQFYPTPQAVIDEVLDSLLERRVRRQSDLHVLEPSCGDGRFMVALRKRLLTAEILGIEVNAERARKARMFGMPVQCANFLEVPATPRFDMVVMNPPFYGLHWQKHLRHALRFLRPADDAADRWKERPAWLGGEIACILPASAFYDGHLEAFGVTADLWNDLPVASFRESGTNVPTGYFVAYARSLSHG